MKMVPGSNCEYACKFWIKSAEKSTKSGQCTNRPVTVQWTHNLPTYYLFKDSDYAILKRVADKEEELM